MSLILLTELSKVYRRRSGDIRALDGANLSVEPGQFVAIQGPSGSGKSTLLLTVGGMLRPTEGEARVLGQSLYSLSPGARARFRARHIGFVFQMFHLAPYLTVLENTLLSAAAGARRAGAKEAREILERFGLGPRMPHKPSELSTGERQRTAMARAMLGRPELLLADEPTGNLDPQSASQILECLSDYHRQGGTVLLVTHEEAVAARAQRKVLLRAGRVVEAAAQGTEPSL